MKKIILIINLICALLILGACSTATKTTENNPTTEKPNEIPKTSTETPKEEPKADTKSDETASQDSKNSDVAKANLDPNKLDASKPLSVDEALNAILADAKAWEGKEIFVKGELNGASTSNMKDGSKVVIQQISNSEGRNVMDCKKTYADGKLPDKPKFSGEYVFKGKIDSIDPNYKEFDLNPCEIQTQ